MNAPLPDNEAERLATLRDLDVLDTPPEVAFDELAALAADICQAPFALVSLVDAERQWFKSKYGLETACASRDAGFCTYTILTDRVLEIEDARLDARFCDNPMVVSDPSIRFYAGAPLRSMDVPGTR